MGKTIEHKYRFVWVMVSSNAHKYDIPVGYVLYSLHVCVCVGALDTTTASDFLGIFFYF